MISNRKNEYFIVGSRAVLFKKEEDGMDILVYDENEKKFIRDVTYLSKVYTSDESDEVTEKEFNAYIEKLKNE